MSAAGAGGGKEVVHERARTATNGILVKLALPAFQVITGFGLFWLSGWMTWFLIIAATALIWPVLELRRNRKTALIQLALSGGLCVLLLIVCAPFIAWSIGGFGP